MDEVHKYPDWSREIKNIYDLMPNLKILFTGSSILELQKSNADLSRRVLNYYLPELSFREFLGIKYGQKLQIFTLEEIIKNYRNHPYQYKFDRKKGNIYLKIYF